MVSPSRSSEDRCSASPRSTSENRPLTKNAQAQARLRARRRAYIGSLESEVKRLQSIVDAMALHPGRNSQRLSAGSSSPSLLVTQSFHSDSDSRSSTISEPADVVQRLRRDNDRLRRERDAFRVQVEALTGYVSRGFTLPPTSTDPSSTNSSLLRPEIPDFVPCGVEQRLSPTPISETDSEDRQSPLIQPLAFMTDDFNQLLSLYGSDLTFLNQLDIYDQGSSGGETIQPPTLPGSHLFEAM